MEYLIHLLQICGKFSDNGALMSKSEQHLVSPNDIHILSSRQAMRIRRIINQPGIPTALLSQNLSQETQLKKPM